jgi:diguanylate cyclase (GGDEF)-like protein/PAS domain S-box-containing protein
MSMGRPSRVLLASSRRVAAGGEAGWWQWLLPVLVLLVVAYAAINVRSADSQASRASEKANRVQAMETAADQAYAFQGSVHATRAKDPTLVLNLTRSLGAMDASMATLVRVAGSDGDVQAIARAETAARMAAQQSLQPRPGNAAESSSQTGSPPGVLFSRLTALLSSAAGQYSKSADRASADARRKLTLTLIGGGLLALLLLWSFWAKRTRLALERSERKFRSLIARSAELVLVVDERRIIRFATPVIKRRLGYGAQDLLSSSLVELIHPDDRANGDLSQHHEEGSDPVHWRLRHQDGSWIDTEAEWLDLRDDLAVRGYVVTIRDVRERKALEEQIRHQAFHDSLTGLANRALFEDRVQHALERLRRDREQGVGMLFIDLDDFKTINDSLGHAAGDELLREVAHRLGESTRRADTVARFGGDEFAVLVEGFYAVETAAVIAERIRASLERPVHVDGEPLFVRASIGIAPGGPGLTSDDLMRNADLAMYAAKASGKGRAAVFEPTMGASARERLQLTVDLRHALRDEQLEVKYQPLVRLGDNQMLGVEALLRWQHPELGELSPLRFIPLAEETGLIVPIGAFVLREACRQLASWRAAHQDQPLTYASVNVSARQFQREGQVLSDVKQATSEAGIDPSHLMLEVTESVLMQDHDAIIRELDALRELGVRIAIDDFGTGYSALSYLRNFPIDTVKMDRSFVRDLGAGKADSALIRSVVELGEALEMEIIAEGIESQEQLNSVTGLRCAMAQGFLFSPPLDASGIEAVLRGDVAESSAIAQV